LDKVVTDSTNSSSEGRPAGLVLITAFMFLGGLSLLVQAAFSSTNAGGLSYYLAQGGLTAVFDSWGLWKGKKWGWVLFVVVSIAGLLAIPFWIFSIPVIWQYYTLALNGITVVFLYYVTRKHVLDFFGVFAVRDEFT